MKTRLVLAPLLVAAVVALAACGGGSSQAVPSDAVALVGSTPVTKTQFNAWIAQKIAAAKASGQGTITLGTPQYQQATQQVVSFLVQATELEQAAQKEGVTVTNQEVTKFLKNIAQLHYGGDEKKFEAALKKSGFTLADAQFYVKVNLLGQKLKAKVTKSVTVSTAEEKQYYAQNAAAYHQAKSRKVRHILVKTKSLADKLEQKLKNGASFAKLAKQYSIDTGTATLGGAYTAVQGQDVPQFDAVAFSLKTHQISAPVHSQFGWHIIQALGPVIPPHTQSFAQVKSTIQAQLLGQKQSTAWGNYLANLQKQWQGKVVYQAGYAPPPTTTVPTVPAPTAPTTTG